MATAVRPMTQAERAKLARSRRAMGLAVYRVEVGRSGLDMLVWRGLLTDDETRDNDAVAGAIGALIRELAHDAEESRVTSVALGRRYDACRKERTR